MGHLCDMTPETAYVKMMWVLGHEKKMAKVKELMERSLVGEISERSEISLSDTRQALRELWTYLPAPLRQLSEDKVLALVNIAILTAWGRMLADLEERQKAGRQTREARP